MKVLFCAGEASGDLYASHLASRILEVDSSTEIGGIGGFRFSKVANRPLIKDSSAWGSISILQSIREGIGALGSFQQFKATFQRESPGIFVPIDFGFMNLRLAKAAKESGWKVVYFVPPGSWRRDRQGADLPQICDHIITPFPWSAEILTKMGANAHFFGHPLKEIHRENRISEHRMGTALLAGSRRSEIEQLVPIYQKLELSKPVRIPSQPRYIEHLHRLLGEEVVDASVDGEMMRTLSRSERAVVCSGTATLEAALAKTPMVVVYRVSRWVELETKVIGWKRPQFISQPNILLQRNAVPELIQENCTVDRIQAEYDELANSGRNQNLAFEELDELLGSDQAITKTVQLLFEIGKP
jgi:lipid-A-disaccharide synthase